MENPLQRIKKFIDFKGVTISSLEKKIGISNGSFGSQLKNNKTIGIDKLVNILKYFPELNSDWVLTGNGEMLKQNIVISTDDKLPTKIDEEIEIKNSIIDALKETIEAQKATIEIQKEIIKTLKGNKP